MAPAGTTAAGARRAAGPRSSSRRPSLDASTWLNDHGDAMYAYALKRCRSPEVAEDLVQEALLAAMKSRSNFRGDSSERTWLIGILRHKLLMHQREQSRKSDITAGLSHDVIDHQFNEKGKWRAAPGRWRGGETSLSEDEEFRAVISDCMKKLPARYADAMRLSEQHGLEAEALGRSLGATVNNVYVMLHRARAGLRTCLERNWFGLKPGDGR